MREIKFRANAVEELVSETQWLEGWGVSSVGFSESYAKEIGRSEDWYLHTDYGNYQVHKGSIGQYTGLKDVNGVEIYEGDILRVWVTKTINFVATVDYLNGAFVIGSIPTGYGYHYRFSSFHNNVGTRYEVIGNIYENKELLEEK